MKQCIGQMQGLHGSVIAVYTISLRLHSCIHAPIDDLVFRTQSPASPHNICQRAETAADVNPAIAWPPMPPATTASLMAMEQETRTRIANTHRQLQLYILDSSKMGVTWNYFSDRIGINLSGPIILNFPWGMVLEATISTFWMLHLSHPLPNIQPIILYR